MQTDPLLDQVVGRHPGGKAGTHAKTPPKRPEHNLDQAIEWFAREYPGRFADERFVRTEITLKRAAHQLYIDKLGNGEGERLLAAGNFAEIGTVLDAIYRATKIPSRLELAAVHKGLKESAAAAHLLEGLLALLAAPGAQTFARLADAVQGLPAPSKGPHVQTWPTVTILPFLADPTRFIVSKPEISKQIAGRMGQDLVYSTAVKWDTYTKRPRHEPTRARAAGAAGRHRLHRRAFVHLGHAQAGVGDIGLIFGLSRHLEPHRRIPNAVLRASTGVGRFRSAGLRSHAPDTGPSRVRRLPLGSHHAIGEGAEAALMPPPVFPDLKTRGTANGAASRRRQPLRVASGLRSKERQHGAAVLFRATNRALCAGSLARHAQVASLGVPHRPDLPPSQCFRPASFSDADRRTSELQGRLVGGPP